MNKMFSLGPAGPDISAMGQRQFSFLSDNQSKVHNQGQTASKNPGNQGKQGGFRDVQAGGSSTKEIDTQKMSEMRLILEQQYMNQW